MCPNTHAHMHAPFTPKEKEKERLSANLPAEYKLNRCFSFLLQCLPYCFDSRVIKFFLAHSHCCFSPVFSTNIQKKNHRKDDNVIMRCCSFCYASPSAAAFRTRVRYGFLTLSPARAICRCRCGCARLCICVRASIFAVHEDTSNTVYTRI